MTKDEIMQKVSDYLDTQKHVGFDEDNPLTREDHAETNDFLHDLLRYKYGEDYDYSCPMEYRLCISEMGRISPYWYIPRQVDFDPDNHREYFDYLLYLNGMIGIATELLRVATWQATSSMARKDKEDEE